jgi:hypothetical protein
MSRSLTAIGNLDKVDLWESLLAIVREFRGTERGML